MTTRTNLENAKCEEPDTEDCVVRDMPRIGKSVEKERRSVVARGGVGGWAGSSWGQGFCLG